MRKLLIIFLCLFQFLNTTQTYAASNKRKDQKPPQSSPSQVTKNTTPDRRSFCLKTLAVIGTASVLGGLAFWAYQAEKVDPDIARRFQQEVSDAMNPNKTAGPAFTIEGLNEALKSNKAIRVTIIGEAHGSEQSKKAHKTFEELAKAQKIFLAYEGRVDAPNWRDGKLGIANEDVNWFVLNMSLGGSLVEQQGDFPPEAKAHAASLFVDQLRDPRNIALWNEKIKAKLANGVDEQVMKFINGVLNSPKKEWNKDFVFQDHLPGLFKVADSFTEEALSWFQSHNLPDKDQVDLELLKAMVKATESEKKLYLNLADYLNYRYRERVMAKSSGQHILKAVKDGKDLVVAVGNNHIKRIQNLLRQSLDLSGGNSIQVDAISK